MKEKERKAFKKRIQEEIDKVKEEITELRELTRPIAPENAIGRVSRMDAINNKSINDAALRKAREKLQKLKYALDKSDKEDFGICMKCRQPIPEGRLMLMPESTTCVRCAER